MNALSVILLILISLNLALALLKAGRGEGDWHSIAGWITALLLQIARVI